MSLLQTLHWPKDKMAICDRLAAVLSSNNSEILNETAIQMRIVGAKIQMPAQEKNRVIAYRLRTTSLLTGEEIANLLKPAPEVSNTTTLEPISTVNSNTAAVAKALASNVALGLERTFGCPIFSIQASQALIGNALKAFLKESSYKKHSWLVPATTYLGGFIPASTPYIGQLAQYNPVHLISQGIQRVLEQSFLQYGRLPTYTAVFTAHFIYHKMPQIGEHLNSPEMDDFCALMYDYADDATYEGHQDHWATQDIGELSTALWNRFRQIKEKKETSTDLAVYSSAKRPSSSHQLTI